MCGTCQRTSLGNKGTTGNEVLALGTSLDAQSVTSTPVHKYNSLGARRSKADIANKNVQPRTQLWELQMALLSPTHIFLVDSETWGMIYFNLQKRLERSQATS